MSMSFMSPAAAFRKAMVQDIQDFKASIKAGEEVWITVFHSTRETRFRLGQVGTSDSGFLNLFGEDARGNLINLSMHYTLLSYQLEAVQSEGGEPQKIGFGIL